MELAYLSNNCLNLNLGSVESSTHGMYTEPSYLVEKVPMVITHSLSHLFSSVLLSMP